MVTKNKLSPRRFTITSQPASQQTPQSQPTAGAALVPARAVASLTSRYILPTSSRCLTPLPTSTQDNKGCVDGVDGKQLKYSLEEIAARVTKTN